MDRRRVGARSRPLALGAGGALHRADRRAAHALPRALALQLAAHALRNSDQPLARIAAQVGYDSEAAFNRAFKRSLGVPPAAWRKAALEP